MLAQRPFGYGPDAGDCHVVKLLQDRGGAVLKESYALSTSW